MLVKDANYQKTEIVICKMEEKPNQTMLCLGQVRSRASLQSKEREDLKSTVNFSSTGKW